jgi:hypothetical protein
MSVSFPTYSTTQRARLHCLANPFSSCVCHFRLGKVLTKPSGSCLFQCLHTKQALFWTVPFPKQSAALLKNLIYDDSQMPPLPKDLVHNVVSWMFMEQTTLLETMFNYLFILPEETMSKLARSKSVRRRILIGPNGSSPRVQISGYQEAEEVSLESIVVHSVSTW